MLHPGVREPRCMTLRYDKHGRTPVQTSPLFAWVCDPKCVLHGRKYTYHVIYDVIKFVYIVWSSVVDIFNWATALCHFMHTAAPHTARNILSCAIAIVHRSRLLFYIPSYAY